MVTQTESQMDAYCTTLATDPSAITSATVVALGLSSGPGSSDLEPAVAGGILPGGSTSFIVNSATSFFVGERVLLDGSKTNAEIVTITAISGTTISCTATLNQHADSATVVGGYGLVQPSQTGRLKITVSGTLVAGSTASTVTAQVYIGSAITVAAPANAGTFDASAVAVGNTQEWISLTGSLESVYSQTVYLGANQWATDTAPSGGASRTVGTPYYVDVGLTSSTGTIQLIEPTLVIEEL